MQCQCMQSDTCVHVYASTLVCVQYDSAYVSAYEQMWFRKVLASETDEDMIFRKEPASETSQHMLFRKVLASEAYGELWFRKVSASEPYE